MLKKIMKKMDKKREKIKMKESQEIKIKYEPNRMIFEVGESVFFLSEETAGSIFGRSVGIEFERVHSRDETFGGLRTLQNYVLIRRLMSKGLTLNLIAKVLNVSQEKLRQFYSSEVARPHTESYNINAIEIERERQAKQEMDSVRESPPPRTMEDKEPPEPGERFLNLLEIKNLQRENLKNKEMAERLKVDEKEFDRFMEKNQKYLDLLP